MSDKILNIPSMSMFNGNWELLLKFMENEGNPPFHLDGDLDLSSSPIESLGNLVSTGGYLDLGGTKIKTLGNLEFVGGSLSLYCCTELTSLGKLISVGGDLNIGGCWNLKTFGNLTNVDGFMYR